MKNFLDWLAVTILGGLLLVIPISTGIILTTTPDGIAVAALVALVCAVVWAVLRVDKLIRDNS